MGLEEQGFVGRLHSFTSATQDGFPAGASQPSSQMHLYLGCLQGKKSQCEKKIKETQKQQTFPGHMCELGWFSVRLPVQV